MWTVPPERRPGLHIFSFQAEQEVSVLTSRVRAIGQFIELIRRQRKENDFKLAGHRIWACTTGFSEYKINTSQP
jgi:hypothetical protein